MSDGSDPKGGCLDQWVSAADSGDSLRLAFKLLCFALIRVALAFQSEQSLHARQAVQQARTPPYLMGDGSYDVTQRTVTIIGCRNGSLTPTHEPNTA